MKNSKSGDIDYLAKRISQASLSLISQELNSDNINTIRAEKKKFDYWNNEINSAVLGYNSGILYLTENTSVFNDPELKDDESGVTLQDCIITTSDLERLKGVDEKDNSIAYSNLQKLFGKSSKVLVAFYLAAQKLFEQKKYTESLNIFTFLTIMNQNIPSFWIGRGSANELLEKWDKALGDYWMAQSINNELVSAYEGLIRISNKLGDKDSLEQCFKIIENKDKLKKSLLAN